MRTVRPVTKAIARIVAQENVHRAWRQVRRNHGAPGVDGMTCEEFPTYARTHWQRIRQDLLDGKYRPSAVRRVEIPKPNGSGERKLGISTVIDRVIQQAIAQVLTPIFDPEFFRVKLWVPPQTLCARCRAKSEGAYKRRLLHGYRG
jgi:RNA-directed DNA polymerase